MSDTRTQREVKIDCPVCLSGNRFNLEHLDRELACRDCGFMLLDRAPLEAIEPAQCIFCGGHHFYFDSPFSLHFLGCSTVCYICEAQYKGVRINEPDEKYDEDVANAVQESEAARTLKERVESYNQGAG